MNSASSSKDDPKISDGSVKSFREVLVGNASSPPVDGHVESGSCFGVRSIAV